jgi:hypothetical protein
MQKLKGIHLFSIGVLEQVLAGSIAENPFDSGLLLG